MITPTPKKSIPTSKKEIKCPPESIAARMELKREVTIGKEEIVARTKQTKEMELKNHYAKDNLNHLKLQKQAPDLGTFTNQFLTDDVLSLVAKFRVIPDFAAMSEVSKKLYELSKTNLKKLKEFHEIYQWSISNEIALRMLKFFSYSESPSIEELKKVTTLDINLRTEDAVALLPEIEKNFMELQTTCNDLVDSTVALSPLVTNFFQELVNLLNLLMAFLWGCMAGLLCISMVPNTSNYSLLFLICSASLLFANLQAGCRTHNIHGLAPFVQFRIAVTGIMDIFVKNLALS